jgi:hypothetical protein
VDGASELAAGIVVEGASMYCTSLDDALNANSRWTDSSTASDWQSCVITVAFTGPNSRFFWGVLSLICLSKTLTLTSGYQ